MMIFRKTSIRTGRKFWLVLCLALACMLLMSVTGAGEETGEPGLVDPVGSSDNYSAVLYDNTSGLPTSEANTLAQTGDGFIWIGSYGGLVRFDGNTFMRMDSTTGVGSVVSLLVDSRDRLWIGTNDNGLALMEQSGFRLWDEADGLGSDKINAITETEDGSLYIGTSEGVSVMTSDLAIQPVADPRNNELAVRQLHSGRDGLVWGLSKEGDIFTLRNGRMLDFIDHRENSIPDITCILPDPDSPEKCYMGTEDSGLYHGDPRTDAGSMEYVNIAPLSGLANIQLISDQIWISSRDGAGVLDGRGFHCLSGLPMSNSFTHVMADYEGNLWFASSRQGVMKLVHNRFSDLFTRFHLSPAVVNSTCMLEDQLFVGTDTGLIVIDEKGPVSTIPLTSAKTASGSDLESRDLIRLLHACRIRSIIRDSRDRLWISTWRKLGLLRYDHGVVTAFTENEGLISEHVRTVCELADGSVIVGGTGGACRIEGDRVTATYDRNSNIINPEVLCICDAPNGDILLGSNGGGIYVISEKGTLCIDKKTGLSSGIVMRIKYDPARKLFWLVTSNSISYMTEDYRVTTVNKFPYSNNFDLYENSRNIMWILSGSGIYVLPTDELLENDEIRPVHYNAANGLPCTATSNSYSELAKDGSLYISGASGVVKVNIEQPMENISELKQAVPYIDADGARFFPDEEGIFTIPSNVRKLTIYAFVFNYSLTDPRVSYYLDGFDLERTTVSRSNLEPVTYTNLPGGTYRFVMEPEDSTGRASKILSVPIIKTQALYEMTWFYILIGTAAVLATVFLARSYTRKKMLALEEKHRQEANRDRIINELKMAAQIQESMLPHDFPPFPDRTEFDLFAVMNPAREVGGDFYDFFLIDDDHLCLVIADVSGKGIPAALFMMVSKVILESFATMGASAADILRKMNDAVCSNNQAEMFVTVWLGILEIHSGKLTSANAGHEYPAVRRSGGRFELHRTRHSFVIGGMEGIRYREFEMQLQPGDTLFVYTDGVPEATDAENNMFGTDRMIESLNRDPDAGPRQLLENVHEDVKLFTKSAEQFDDLTMLCMEYHGA